jgi:hypothetical protein
MGKIAAVAVVPSDHLRVVVFISFYQFWEKSLFQRFLVSSFKVWIHSKHCLDLILWVPTSLIGCRHDGLRTYKVCKSWGWISQLHLHRLINHYLVLLLIKLSSYSNTFDAEMRSDWVSADISYWLSAWRAVRAQSEQNLRANISTTTREIKKPLLNFIGNRVSYAMLTFERKESCFRGVDSFRVEVPPLDAIFRPVQKILHNSFKNQAFGTGLPPSKCMRTNVFRHEEL